MSPSSSFLNYYYYYYFIIFIFSLETFFFYQPAKEQNHNQANTKLPNRSKTRNKCSKFGDEIENLNPKYEESTMVAQQSSVYECWVFVFELTTVAQQILPFFIFGSPIFNIFWVFDF
jgi:hypothetical protein